MSYMVGGYDLHAMAVIVALNGGVTAVLLLWFLAYVATHKCKK